MPQFSNNYAESHSLKTERLKALAAIIAAITPIAVQGEYSGVAHKSLMETLNQLHTLLAE